MYYFTVVNSVNRSSLSAIHLVMVAHASDVKEYGHAVVLKPFIDDLKRLESGLHIHINNVSQAVYGTVVHLPGDNLAANETQGFVCSFSANHFCRFCKLSSKETKIQCREQVSSLRSKAEHEQDIAQVYKCSTKD